MSNLNLTFHVFVTGCLSKSCDPRGPAACRIHCMMYKISCNHFCGRRGIARDEDMKVECYVNVVILAIWGIRFLTFVSAPDFLLNRIASFPSLCKFWFCHKWWPIAIRACIATELSYSVNVIDLMCQQFGHITSYGSSSMITVESWHTCMAQFEVFYSLKGS